MSLTHPTPRTAAAVALWAAQVLVVRSMLDRARRDPLTGLYTRDGWSSRAQRMLRPRLRRSGRHQVGVLLIDLDYFKDVNDTHGHGAGDRLLQAVADRLAHWCGPHGVVRGTAGRIGGDEFVAVVRIESATSAEELVRGLHALLTRPVPGLPPGVVPAASIGLATTGDFPADLPRLMERADAAMYVAKAAGAQVRVADQDLPEAPTVRGRRRGRPGTAPSTPVLASTLLEVAA